MTTLTLARLLVVRSLLCVSLLMVPMAHAIKKSDFSNQSDPRVATLNDDDKAEYDNLQDDIESSKKATETTIETHIKKMRTQYELLKKKRENYDLQDEEVFKKCLRGDCTGGDYKSTEAEFVKTKEAATKKIEELSALIKETRTKSQEFINECINKQEAIIKLAEEKKQAQEQKNQA